MKKVKLSIYLLSLISMTGITFASTVGNEVIGDLKSSNFDANKSVWSVTQIENVNNIGIYQVPFFQGNQNLVTPADNNLPPAVNFAKQYEALIATAETSVDIASLDLQDGYTLNAIRDGLTALDQKGKAIEVRIIVGSIPYLVNVKTGNNPLTIQKATKYITSKLSPSSKLTIYVGTYRAGNLFSSWNHAKILAVDSTNVITGGINFIDSGYASGINPVNDLSLYYPNMDLALPANKFLDNEWTYLCKYRASKFDRLAYQKSGSIDLNVWKNGTLLEDQPCPKGLGSRYNFASNHQYESDTSADYAISTGRLAAVSDWKQDTSDIAQVSLINHANSYVKISQQSVFSSDIAWLYRKKDQPAFSDKILEALCGALARGVTVELMTSGYYGQPGIYPSTLPFGVSPGFPSYSSTDQLMNYMVQYGHCNIADVHDTSKLQIKVNGNKQDPYASTSSYLYFPNHSKVVIVDSKNQSTGLVDGKLVYVGSHNTYDQSHAEYGVIVDSKGFVDRLEEQFWDYNWNSAQ